MKTCYVAFDFEPDGFCKNVFLGNGGRAEHGEAPSWLKRALMIIEGRREFVLTSPAKAPDGDGIPQFEVWTGQPLMSDGMTKIPVEYCRLNASIVAPMTFFTLGERDNPNCPAVFFMSEHSLYSRRPKNVDLWLQKYVRSLKIRLPYCEPIITGGWGDFGPATTIGAWADDGLLIVTINNQVRECLRDLHAAAISGSLAIRYGIPTWEPIFQPIDGVAQSIAYKSGLEMTVCV